MRQGTYGRILQGVARLRMGGDSMRDMQGLCPAEGGLQML